MQDNRGTWSLNKIAYAVKNNLEAGLNTTGNYNFDISMLEHIIIASRNQVIKQMKQSGQLNTRELTQEINCIPLDCEDFALCCNEPDTNNPELHFTVPVFDEIDYVGTVDEKKPFKIFKDHTQKYAKYREFKLRKRTYVRFRLHEGLYHGFIFNPPTKNIKYISIRAIFENPLDVNDYSCCNLDPVEDRFPMPDYMVNQIINQITSNWSSWYYRFTGAGSANNQTSLG